MKGPKLSPLWDEANTIVSENKAYPGQHRFCRNWDLTVSSELETGSFEVLVFSPVHAMVRAQGTYFFKGESSNTPRAPCWQPWAGEERECSSQKLHLQQGSHFSPRQLWSRWSFHKHRVNEEEDGYVFNLIHTDEKWGIHSLQHKDFLNSLASNICHLSF